MDEIAKIRMQYCESIRCLSNMEDVVRILPKPSYTNFFQIMQEIVKSIKEELTDLADMKQEALSDEELQIVNEDIQINEMKLNECLKRFEEAKQKVEIDDEVKAIESNKKDIMLAKSDLGNIFLESDFKDISKEYYSDIIDMINELSEGKEDNGQYNVQRQRKLSNNSKINGIGELKRFGIRLYYLPIASDVLLIGAHEKHDNNPKEIIRFLENRRKLVDSEYKYLKDNEDAKNHRIEEDKESLNSIIDTLKSLVRGERHE